MATLLRASEQPPGLLQMAKETFTLAALSMKFGTFRTDMENIGKAVEQAIRPWVDAVNVPTNATKSGTERIELAVDLALRDQSSKRGSLSSTDTGIDTRLLANSNFQEPSVEKWSQIQSDSDFQKMISDLTPLHVLPLQTSKIAAILMKSTSPAGLIFILGTKVPNVNPLKDMGAARTQSSIQAAINEACALNR